MEQIAFERAYFIKLGRGGEWAESSIRESIARIGWPRQDLDDINLKNWDKIRGQLLEEHPVEKGGHGKATRDLHALQWICQSTPADLWITFSQGVMWWCRLATSGICSDKTSKFRRVEGKWSCEDVGGRTLAVNGIPGELSKIQRFQATVCHVRELETLRRLVNDRPSSECEEIQRCHETLTASVARGIKKLHWKDLEIFVDLVFTRSGWRRLSGVGGTMKGIDLELEDPITTDRYVVQVKSSATQDDFARFIQADLGPHRKRYFVVHTPSDELARPQTLPPGVELILPARLSDMAVRLGLVDWLLNRIK